jgi:DNA polymerase-1
MIMQVHDELILEAKKSESEEVLSKVKEIMEAAVDLDIPLIVEASVGSNWNEAH